MRNLDGENFITIGKVAKMVGRGTSTIKNWYEWAEKHDRLDDLPEVKTDFDAKGTRYFKESEIQKLIEFRDSVRYGMMADVNREKWGQRGSSAGNSVK